MSIFKFMKERVILLILIAFIIIIVNMVLFLDPNLSKSEDTLIYMDVLVLITSLIFIVFDYIRNKKKSRKFIGCIHNLQEDNSEVQDNEFYSEVKKIIMEKDEEIENLRNELEEINDYMTNWIHEVKIPISVLQIIGKRVNDLDKSKELSKQINSEVSRIDKLVEQAIYSSRAGNYSSDFMINEVNLGQTVREVIKKNKYQFIYNKIDLNIGDLDKSVLTDKKWITHIIELIVDNAIKYSDKGGKIEIFLKEINKGTELHIKDYGIGISHQDIERIFDKGFTGSNGRKRTKSTGMGLYISKKILNKLSHNIEVVSTKDKFCDVYITFYNLSDYFDVF